MSARRRLGVVTLDQAVSGGSNLLAAVVAARLLPPGAFGVFGIVLLVFGLVQGVFRAIVCMPVLMQRVHTDDQMKQAMGGASLYAVIACLGLVVAGIAARTVDGRLMAGLLLLAVFLPLLLLEDLGRFLAIGMLRPGYALALDTVWLVLFVAAAVPLRRPGTTLSEVLSLWAGSGAVTGVLVLFVWPALRSARPALGWLAANWHLSWRFASALAAAQLAALALTFIVRSFFGSITLGAVLGCQMLMRPYSTVEAAVLGAGVAEIANAGDRDRAVVREAIRTTVVASGVAAVNAVAMLLLPDAIGVRVLGETWPHAAHFLVPFAVQLLILSVAIGPRVGVTGTGRVDLALRISLGFIPGLLTFAVLGAMLGGVAGCIWAVDASWFAVAVVWWLALFRIQREPVVEAAAVRLPEDA